MIKVNKNQNNNPCLKELIPGSFKLVENCANVAGGNTFGTDSIYEDFQIDKISVLFVSLKYHIERRLYIKQRFEEVYAARRNHQKVLLLLVDCSDEQSYMTDL